MTQACMIKDRGIIEISGPDSRDFLQGLITADIKDLTLEKPLYAAILTPQGKYLFDFILYDLGDKIYLDCESTRTPDLLRRLMMYKLRANVNLVDVSNDFRIWAIWGESKPSHPCFQDPRHWKIGDRAIVPKGENLIVSEKYKDQFSPLKLEDYNVERITLGIPDGSKDCQIDKYFWLECLAENNNGVSFEKGCYVGQEQTTRMKHRTTIKKSLIPVRFTQALVETIENGHEIQTEAGKNAGEIRSIQNNVGLAYLRLQHIHDKLFCKAIEIIPLND